MGVQFTITEAERPRIYVACLASYNDGHLHGAWIDAAREAWALWEDIQRMLRTSPVAGAEEYVIHDYEGFSGVRIVESEGIDRVAEIAAFIVEHGPLGAALFDHYNGDLDEAVDAIIGRYLGMHASLAGHMQEITEEAIEIPQPLQYYIDWDAMARDAELSGDLFTIQTDYDAVHVFASR